MACYGSTPSSLRHRAVFRDIMLYIYIFYPQEEYHTNADRKQALKQKPSSASFNHLNGHNEAIQVVRIATGSSINMRNNLVFANMLQRLSVFPEPFIDVLHQQMRICDFFYFRSPADEMWQAFLDFCVYMMTWGTNFRKRKQIPKHLCSLYAASLRYVLSILD